MATNFYSVQTDELLFVRFYGGERRGTCYDFGTVSQFERVRATFRRGDVAEPDGAALRSDPETARDLDRLACDGRATFGEMSVTVVVGSGDLFNFSVEE